MTTKDRIIHDAINRLHGKKPIRDVLPDLNPFKGKKPDIRRQQLEFRLHVCVVEQLPKWFPQIAWLHIPNRPGDASDGYFKKVMGAKSGAPDLLFTWRQYGQLCGGLIELKAEGGSLGRHQNMFLSAWDAIGWHTAVCKTAQGVFDSLCCWGLEPASSNVQEPDYSSEMEKKCRAFDFFKP